MARPPFIVTDQHRAQVRKLSGLALKHDHIAEIIEISPKTLRRHFRKELTVGPIEMKARLSSKLLETALGGNVPALIFLGKSMLGMRDNPLPEKGPESIPDFVVNVQEKIAA